MITVGQIRTAIKDAPEDACIEFADGGKQVFYSVAAMRRDIATLPDDAVMGIAEPEDKSLLTFNNPLVVP